MENVRCRTVPLPTPRSSWADCSSSTCRISTRHSRGPPAIPPVRAAASRCGRTFPPRCDASMDPRDVVEHVARESYGRLLAYLASRSHDVAAAEDALGEAFQAALASWSRDGVPDKPEAWLLTVARRKLIDAN